MPKAKNPHERTGVFKTIEEVPTRYRLRNHRYERQNQWAEYLDAELSDAAESVRYETELVEESWKTYMDRQDQHYALATPEDIEGWCQNLLDEMTAKRAYNPYWVRIEEFYDYLLWHTDHPHVYHPPLMAAGTGDAAERVWQTKIAVGEGKYD